MSDDESTPSRFSIEVGSRLRAVRKAKDMSLEEVESASGGRWSASAIGAYERGFRNLSLPRLRELAEFYGVPMTILLGEGVTDGTRAPRMVLDLAQLATVTSAEPVLRYLRTIIDERGDYNGRVLTVRRDDVRALCAILQVDERGLVQRLSDWDAIA